MTSHSSRLVSKLIELKGRLNKVVNCTSLVAAHIQLKDVYQHRFSGIQCT